MIKYSDLQIEAVEVILGDTFDFELCRANDDTSWITLEPNSPFTVIAGEGSGGVFIAYGDSKLEYRSILFVSSEGQSGKVGNNLPQFISMILAIPYWLDLLKFSGGGDLSEMRKAARFMELEYKEDFPELSADILKIKSRIRLLVIEDPIELLHSCVHSTDCSVVADDGWKYETLFNSFVSSDNKSWT